MKLEQVEEASKDPLANEWVLYASVHKEFEWYMRNLVGSAENTEEDPKKKGGVKSMDLGTVVSQKLVSASSEAPLQSPITTGQSIAWLNAFAARIFYDFSRDRDWIWRVRNRIQRKLATIRLPYFIEELNLSQLDPGLVTPRVCSVHEPSLNDWGLWVDLEVQYSGGLQLVLETKINLMKLKSGSLAVASGSGSGGRKSPGSASPSPLLAQRQEETASGGRNKWEIVKMEERQSSRYSDPEMPESPESSPDEDNAGIISNLAFNKPDGTAKESTGKKLLNFVEKVSQSNLFQEATENKYVKRVMQGISETPLILTVEVLYLEGTLAVNIPSPPSDRLWYAFRRPPKLTLRAQPRVGEKVVGMTQITDWIQNRLRLLLEKNLVLPNMDDIIVPVMSGNKMFTEFNK